MEKKYLNGSLSRNITFGLSWLLGWLPAVIVWLVDKDKLDLEDKRELASMIIAAVISYVCAATIIGGIISLAIAVCCIIAAIQAFMGKSFKIPGVYHIATAIIK